MEDSNCEQLQLYTDGQIHGTKAFKDGLLSGDAIAILAENFRNHRTSWVDCDGELSDALADACHAASVPFPCADSEGFAFGFWAGVLQAAGFAREAERACRSLKKGRGTT